MSTEDQVRAIVRRVVFRHGEADDVTDEAVAALMRLVEPPETGSIAKQIQALELCRLCLRETHLHNVRQDVDAALATLRWVQGLKGKDANAA